jgi:hypothetical protein
MWVCPSGGLRHRPDGFRGFGRGRFAPAEGKANIYVARGAGSYGGAVNFQIVVDGKTLGNIAPGTYFIFSCEQGAHVVVAISQYNTEKAKIDVEQNRNYFFDAGWHMGLFSGSVAIKQVAEDAGKKLVQQCKRAESLMD